MGLLLSSSLADTTRLIAGRTDIKVFEMAWNVDIDHGISLLVSPANVVREDVELASLDLIMPRNQMYGAPTRNELCVSNWFVVGSATPNTSALGCQLLEDSF